MRPGIKAWQHSTRWSFLIRIRHFHISHKTPCLPPKFCIFHFSWVLQSSQNFGGQANKVNFGCSASGECTMAENLILCAFYIGKLQKLPNKQHCSIPMILKEWRFSLWDMILQTNILQQISWKLQEACGTHRDPFISDACCFSQPCFDEAANLSYKLGGERELWLRFIAGRRTWMFEILRILGEGRWFPRARFLKGRWALMRIKILFHFLYLPSYALLRVTFLLS